MPILGEKKSPRPRALVGTFKKTKKTKCPNYSANSGRRKSGTRAETPQPKTVDFLRGPVCSVLPPVCSGWATTRQSVRTLLSRARPQDYGRMPNANSLKQLELELCLQS